GGLEREGFRVVAAFDERDGAERAARDAPDLIPDGTGEGAAWGDARGRQARPPGRWTTRRGPLRGTCASTT
ncbi:MAG TPA: hypothetical protein VF521_03085, partial [Pyrinomonadaceae bacterium]